MKSDLKYLIGIILSIILGNILLFALLANILQNERSRVTIQVTFF